MAYKVGVAESKPPLPEEAVWERGPEFREFLLTKCTYRASPFFFFFFLRPVELTRWLTIDD
jgi:hypothetical protein